MTREEIREGIAKRINHNDSLEWCVASEQVRLSCLQKSDGILSYLHSKGVVIKVDRELPQCPYNKLSWGDYEQSIYKQGQEDMVKVGYGAFEPLIKE